MGIARSLLCAAALTAASSFAADGLYVDAGTLRQVQQTLNQRGFHRVGVDGRMGPQTQAALRQFQRSERLEPTGQLNRQTLIALGLQQPEGTAAAAEPRYSASVIRKVQQTLANRGFKAGPTDGTLHAATRAALRQFQKSENLEDSGQLNERTLAALGVEPEAVVEAAAQPSSTAGAPARPLRLSSESVRQVQHRLNELGFNVGREDGVMGQATRHALVEFQRDQHLRITGRPDADTMSALHIDGGVASR